MTAKLFTLPAPTRPERAGTARLRKTCAESRLTQAEMGAPLGISDRTVRKLLRHNRKRPDRLDLLCAVEALTARKKAA